MNPFLYTRRQTHPVFVGQIGVGGLFPLRVQSMLTSDTKNIDDCIKEIIDLVNVGCEIIRLTVPTKADLDNLKNIREAMKKKGLNVPLVADIHFTPSIALDAVDYVEKVRINPGNFVDKKRFQKREYTDDEYRDELLRIEEKFTPLVLKCKERHIAMRIGTNHGSLSDRILNRYGDTPEGMVESALEFLRIAEKHSYHNIILSMKASNVQVMISAYRLLALRLKENNLKAYPFHLGVTEAGLGEDARIKSAMGIGTLLEEGLGDTIRVSLTEDSVHEIPVAYSLVAPYNAHFATAQNLQEQNHEPPAHFNISYQRRFSPALKIGDFDFGSQALPLVWASYSTEGYDHSCFAKNSDPVFEGVEFFPEQIDADALEAFQNQNRMLGLISEQSPDLLHPFAFHKRTWLTKNVPDTTELQKLIEFCASHNSHLEIALRCEKNEDHSHTVTMIHHVLSQNHFANFSLSLVSSTPRRHYKDLAQNLKKIHLDCPLHLRYSHQHDLPQIDASIQLGSLLVDGLGDSVQIMRTDLSYAQRLSLSYGLLQACRLRMTKTEYIACPSCGRTQFHLQDVTAKIKSKTSHLKGVKIGIMGCIVNGPGEMADADFGYVGTGLEKISLYVGQTCVVRNIPEAQAVDQLIDLIKNHGRWVDP